MVSAKERISAIFEYGGFATITALSKALGLKTPQAIYDIQSGKTQDISARLANKIFLVFPEINEEWVLSGEGEMLCRDSPKDVPLVFSGDAKLLVMQMSATLHQQEANIAKLTEMVDRLTGGKNEFKKDSAG